MKSLLKIWASFIGIAFYGLSFAASVDHFEVKASPTKVKIGESVDVTISAVDKSGNVVKDYVWEVLIFSQTDNKAEFPGIKDDVYNFKASDAGIVKFENGVKFTKSGMQQINVAETSNYDILWETEVEVTAEATSQTGDITISYPENGTTLPTTSLKVTGTTQKNHKITLNLNGEKDIEGISDGNGAFEIKLDNLPSGESVIKAKLLDADGKVIGTSSEVFFSIDNNSPVFKKLTFDPSETEYTPETSLVAKVEATPNLSTVTLIINDILTTLTEQSAGIYTGDITTPKDAWEYSANVVLKNELWVEAKANNVGTLKVKAVELLAGGPRVEETVAPSCEDFKSELDVKNIVATKLKSKTVLTWDKAPKATSYNIYKKERSGSGETLIENVTDTTYEILIQWDQVEYDDFVIKAVFKDDICDVEGNASDMTKVQTGPQEILLLILAMWIGAGIFYFRRRQA